MRADVRHLLCLLTKNNEDATEQLNHILVQRVTSALEGHRSNPVMVSNITKTHRRHLKIFTKQFAILYPDFSPIRFGHPLVSFLVRAPSCTG